MTHGRSAKLILAAWITLLLAVSVGAQRQVTIVSAVEPIEAKLQSKLMGRPMPYRVLLPPTYNDKVRSIPKYPVVYLLHGLTGNYANWTDKSDLKLLAATWNFIIVTPEGANGWYSDSVTVPNDQFESYIIKELIPEIDKNYRTAADREHRVIAGLSMGGYGALKFGLKYPEMFSLVGSFSGAIGAASFTSKNAAAIGKNIEAILGDEDSTTRKANDVFQLSKELSAETIKSLPFIYLSCGTEDFLVQNNRDYLKVLIEKKVPHEYREHPGVHDWKFWNDQVREFLYVVDRKFK